MAAGNAIRPARLSRPFENLERLAEVDFDQSVNASLRLQASIVLAETVGVPGARILGTTGDLDTLMTK